MVSGNLHSQPRPRWVADHILNNFFGGPDKRHRPVPRNTHYRENTAKGHSRTQISGCTRRKDAAGQARLRLLCAQQLDLDRGVCGITPAPRNYTCYTCYVGPLSAYSSPPCFQGRIIIRLPQYGPSPAAENVQRSAPPHHHVSQTPSARSISGSLHSVYPILSACFPANASFLPSFIPLLMFHSSTRAEVMTPSSN